MCLRVQTSRRSKQGTRTSRDTKNAAMCGEVLGQRNGEAQLHGWRCWWPPWPIMTGFRKGPRGLSLRGGDLAEEGEGELGMQTYMQTYTEHRGGADKQGDLTLSEQLGHAWSAGPQGRGCLPCMVMGFLCTVRSPILSSVLEVHIGDRQEDGKNKGKGKSEVPVKFSTM